MGVEDPAEHDVHEEALGLVLGFGQVSVLQVARDHAAVVGPVPGPGRSAMLVDLVVAGVVCGGGALMAGGLVWCGDPLPGSGFSE